MSAFLSDFSLAVRQLRRSPRYALACVLMLSMGLTIAIVMFSVLKSIVLSALPYDQADRLLVLGSRHVQQGDGGELTYAELKNFGDAAKQVSDVGYFNWGGETIPAGSSPPRELTVARVSRGLFAALAATPLLGRTINAEDIAGERRVVVLSEREWRGEFAADPKVLGRVLKLQNGDAEVVGVMPEAFQYPGPNVNAWLPLLKRDEPAEGSPVWVNARFVSGVARMRPEASVDSVLAELQSIQAEVTQRFGASDQWRVAAVPILHALLGDTRWMLWGCFGIALLVLGVACTNVGVLLHARLVEKRREQAVALAIGAPAARLLRALVLELAILSLLACTVAMIISVQLLSVFSIALSETLPRGDAIELDVQVVVTAVLMALLAVAVATAMGARIHAAPADALRSAQITGFGRLRLLRMGPFLGIAMSMVALVATSAVALSLVSLQRVAPGFRVEGVHAVQMFRGGGPKEWPRFSEAVLERLESEPGVEAVAVTTAAPLSLIGNFDIDLLIAGRSEPEPFQAGLRRVSAGYLNTLQIPVVRGRDFSTADRAGSERVAIINERLARQSFGEEDPIGKTLGLPIGNGPRVEFQIVGVTSDIKNKGPREPTQPEVLIPFAQSPWVGMTFMVQSRLPAENVLAMIERAIHAEAPDEAVTRRFSLAGEVAGTLSMTTLFAQLLFLFGTAALLLAGFGVYALSAFAQRQRQAEYGLKLALGARSNRLIADVLGSSLRTCLLGLLVGGLTSWLALYVLRSQLFGLGAEPISAYLLSSMLMVLAVLAASWIPARRAVNSDPMTTLRHE